MRGQPREAQPCFPHCFLLPPEHTSERCWTKNPPARCPRGRTSPLSPRYSRGAPWLARSGVLPARSRRCLCPGFWGERPRVKTRTQYSSPSAEWTKENKKGKEKKPPFVVPAFTKVQTSFFHQFFFFFDRVARLLRAPLPPSSAANPSADFQAVVLRVGEQLDKPGIWDWKGIANEWTYGVGVETGASHMFGRDYRVAHLLVWTWTTGGTFAAGRARGRCYAHPAAVSREWRNESQFWFHG